VIALSDDCSQVTVTQLVTGCAVWVLIPPVLQCMGSWKDAGDCGLSPYTRQRCGFEDLFGVTAGSLQVPPGVDTAEPSISMIKLGTHDTPLFLPTHRNDYCRRLQGGSSA
jgi:hypothetical protein